MECFLIVFGMFFATNLWLCFLAWSSDATIQSVVDWARGKK